MRRAAIIMLISVFVLSAAAGWVDQDLQTSKVSKAGPVIVYDAGGTSLHVGALMDNNSPMYYTNSGGSWTEENIGGYFGMLSFGTIYDFGLDGSTLPFYAISNETDDEYNVLYYEGGWQALTLELSDYWYIHSLQLIPHEQRYLAGVHDTMGGSTHYQLFQRDGGNLNNLGGDLWSGTENNQVWAVPVYFSSLRGALYAGANDMVDFCEWEEGSETWDVTSYTAAENVITPFDAEYAYVDTFEYVYVAYVDNATGNLELKVCELSNPGIWDDVTALPTVSPAPGTPVKLAVYAVDTPPAGVPHILYIGDHAGEYYYHLLRYDASNDIWVDDQITDRSAQTMLGDVTVDINGYPRVAYIFDDAAADDGLGLAVCDNYPPNPFGLKVPNDGDTFHSLPVRLEWFEATDFENDTVEYTIEIAPDMNFDPQHTRYYVVGTNLLYDVTDLPDGRHYWRVMAEDPAGGFRFSSEVRYFFQSVNDSPQAISASAFDVGGNPGIDEGDYVDIVFEESVEDADGWTDIDELLPLQSDHSWNDGSGTIADYQYLTTDVYNDTLRVTLHAYDGDGPTVEPGDVIDFDNNNGLLTDLTGNPIQGTVTIGGSFGSGGPVFDVAHPFNLYLEYAQSNELTCAFDSGAPTEVTMYYAPGGTLDWQSQAMTYDSADDLWMVELAPADLDISGIVYGFHAVDTDGGESWFPDGLLAGEAALYPVVHADSYEVYPELPVGDEVTDYRLISLPAVFPDGADGPEDQFTQELGAYDVTAWRLFDYDNPSGDYVEFDPAADNCRLNPGAVYWMITRDGLPTVTLEDFITLDSGSRFTYQLSAGWNWIATPFPYDVEWLDCYTDGVTVEEPIPYYGDYSTTSDGLYLLEGYWLYAEGDGELYIPPLRYDGGTLSGGAPVVAPEADRSSGALTSKGSGTLPAAALAHPNLNPGGEASTSRVADHPALVADDHGDGGRWRLDFELRDAAGRDALHYLGVDPDAADGPDPHDRHDPPAPAGTPNLSFIGKDAEAYYSDLRAPITDGEIWEFHTTAAGTAELRWRLDGRPAGCAALLETPAGRIVDLLAEESITLSAAETGSGLPCRVYIGTPEWLDGEFSARSLTLAQSYPNPAAGLARIEFSLPAAAEVELTVYDLAGRRVDTLVDGPLAAGRHAVAWDAATVSPGVYLYRLTTPDDILTRRLVIAR